MSSTKVFPQTTATKKKSGVTVQTVLDVFLNLDPSLYTQCADALKADVTVVNVLNKLGFIQEAEHIAALLPPQLRDFNIIKEEESVAAALNAPSFVAAQQAMQSAPNDPNNLTTLQAEIANMFFPSPRPPYPPWCRHGSATSIDCTVARADPTAL